jgi:uncharacterized membrane protein
MDGKIQDFLKKLQNKITYYIYKTVNDDDANKYAEEEKKHTLKEDYEPADPEKEKEKEKDSDSSEESTTDTVLRYAQLVLIPVLSVALAVFVANELIVYPTAIRIIFFIITIILCNVNNFAFILLLGYYICAAIVHWYVNRKHDKPFVRYLPKIFGIMPFYPYNADEKVTGLASYLKPSNIDKKNENTGKTELGTLQEVIANYRESLSKSFPYYENVKDDSVFVKRMKDLDEYFTELTETKYNEDEINNNQKKYDAEAPKIAAEEKEREEEKKKNNEAKRTMTEEQKQEYDQQKLLNVAKRVKEAKEAKKEVAQPTVIQKQ